MSRSRQEARRRRHRRVRKKVHGTAQRPRIAVFRSNRHVYAQAIDDERGHTVAAASTLDAGDAGATVETARAVGERLAARLREQGVTRGVFDRGGFRYHGQVAAVADGVRESGIAL